MIANDVVALSFMIAELGIGSVRLEVRIAGLQMRKRWTHLPRKGSESEKETQELDRASAGGTSPIGSARALRHIGRRKVRLGHGSTLAL